MTHATISQYARLCRVSYEAIRKRIKTGRIETVTMDVAGKETEMISLKRYPPVKFNGRPKTKPK